MFLKRGNRSRCNLPNKFVFCAYALKKSLMTQLKCKTACFTVIVPIRGTQ